MAKDIAQKIQQNDIQKQSHHALHEAACLLIAKAQQYLHIYAQKQKNTDVRLNYRNIIMAFHNAKNAQVLIGNSEQVKDILQKIYTLNLDIAKKHQNSEHELWFQSCLQQLLDAQEK